MDGSTERSDRDDTSQSGPSNESQSTNSSPLDTQDVQIALLKRNTFTLELPVMLLFFSYNLTSTVFQNEILYQTCLSNNSNKTFCEEIINQITTDDSPEIIAIETNASRIFMARAILENIVPAFISFFIGPWSDKYGRKPILLSTYLGELGWNLPIFDRFQIV